mgnify:CR=1 FL=1
MLPGMVRHNLEQSPALARKLQDLPRQPGVYLYRDREGNLLYVGKAKVLRNRIKSYFQAKHHDAKTRRLVGRIWDLEFIVCETELEALVLENNLIKAHQPPFNIVLRDDKNYPYVKLTWRDAFPQVFVTRRVKKDGSLYFGPFFPASTAYRTAELVQRFFQIRDCDLDIDGKRSRACMKFQIHHCTGPCIGAVDGTAYREQAKEARLFLEGKRDELKKRLEGAMWAAARHDAFEQAARFRDALQQVDAWFTRQKAAVASQEATDILGSALLDGRACVHRLVMREGRIVGRQEHVLEDVEAVDGAVLAAVLQRLYSSEEVPARIVVEVEPVDVELLREWLGSMRGSRPAAWRRALPFRFGSTASFTGGMKRIYTLSLHDALLIGRASCRERVVFVRDAVARLARRGGVLAHVDVTIVAEAPKIGPHREAMRARVAEICGISLDRVGVKATTNEKLGFVGRREGIAAMASATVRLPLA